MVAERSPRKSASLSRWAWIIVPMAPSMMTIRSFNRRTRAWARSAGGRESLLTT